MRQLVARTLSLPVAKRLDKYQTAVDGEGTYASRVAAAKSHFKKRNRADNKSFIEIRNALREMCSGFGRCSYCEVSEADEIEHVWPKDLYPGRVFQWDNMVLACGPCNGPKNSHFAVFRLGDSVPFEVSRKRGDPVTEPASGDPVFLDPRSEDPLAYMELDLVDTFRFVPTGEKGTREFERASFTIALLRLNERDLLIKARKSAFIAYRACLVQYRELKRRTNIDSMQKLSDEIRRMPHPTVWHEMKRQHRSHSDWGSLFNDVPEALKW